MSNRIFEIIESQFTALRRGHSGNYGREQFESCGMVGSTNEEVYNQLCGYLDRKSASTVDFLIFDFRKGVNKEHMAEWAEIDNKRIFDVIV